MENQDDFFDKTRKMADKAEEKLKEAFEKAKKSETIEKISGMVDKAEDFVEKKIDKLKESDTPGKIETFRDEAEERTEEMIDKAKSYTSRLSGEVEDVIDALKGKRKKRI
jgi:hypothetical protein